MIPEQFISSRRFISTARRMVRELLICVALPSALLVCTAVVAQNSRASQSQSRSDEQIATEINHEIQASDVLRPLNLSVWVHDGTATLSGAVPSADLRDQAASLVQSVPGVNSVDDQITIGAAANTGGAPQQGAPGMPPPPPTEAEQNRQGAYPPSYPGQNEPPPQPQGSGRNSSPPSYYPAPGQQRMLTVPSGTPLTVMVLQTIDSRHTKPGKHFRGVVVRDVILMNGATAIPRGAYVDGTVIDSRGSGPLKGHPKLALQLDHVDVGNASYPMTSFVWARRGPGKGGQTAGTVGGTALAGAVVGGAVGGGPTALLGAVLGGLGGAGLSAASRGPQLFVPAESVLTFNLNAPVVVREPTLNEMRSLAGNVPARNYGPPGYGPGYPPPPGYGPPPPGYPPPGGPPGGYPY